jgi:sugar-specific transcriptional regulator TrmB
VGVSSPGVDDSAFRKRPVAVQDLVDHLRELGLDEDEASIYVHLGLQGPLRATEVAEAARVSRPQAYRILDLLAQRGYVAASATRPTRYEARALDFLLEDYKADLRARSDLVLRKEADLKRAFAAARDRQRPEASEPSGYFALHRGRDEIMRRVSQLVAHATSSVCLLNTHPAALHIMRRFGQYELLGDAVRRGVSVQMLLTRSPLDLAALRDIPSGIDVRTVATNKMVGLTLVDEAQALSKLRIDPSPHAQAEGSVALWTDTSAFVASQAMLFQSLWATAIPAPTATEAAGPPTEARRFPARQGQASDDTVSST